MMILIYRLVNYNNSNLNLSVRKRKFEGNNDASCLFYDKKLSDITKEKLWVQMFSIFFLDTLKLCRDTK